MVSPGNYWYVACQSNELTPQRPLAAQILDEWLVCFRDARGQPVALPDRCLHRCGRLSRGRIAAGELTCSYHGWSYDGAGKVVCIPSEGGREPAGSKHLSAKPYACCERDGYVYVRLERTADSGKPFPMPHFRERGWHNLRLVHDFNNTVTNCVENFIDVPHTAYVHRGIFRNVEGEPIEATLVRKEGEVHVAYQNEKRNLGSFSWFLNPRGEPIQHTDSFYVPNVTQVSYRVGTGNRVAYFITSQSVPLTSTSTRVYTDITFRFGIWSWLARPLVRRQARRVIRQDVEELNAQMEVIQKYGGRFIDSPADRIHKLVSQLREALDRGEDPRHLPDHESSITFWV